MSAKRGLPIYAPGSSKVRENPFYALSSTYGGGGYGGPRLLDHRGLRWARIA
jgi:hypothetical protein